MSSSPAPIFVACTPGAGGRHLGRVLAAAGMTPAPVRWFDPLAVPRRSRAWGLQRSGADFPARYLEAVRSRAAGGRLVSELLWSHHRWLVGMARAAGPPPDGEAPASDSDADVVDAWFPDLEYLHLRCRDRTAQAVRWYRLMHPEARHDPAVVPDFQELRWLEAMIEKHDRAWQVHFHLHNITATTVDYEDLRAGEAAAVAAVVGALGGAEAAGDLAGRFGPALGPGVQEPWGTDYLQAYGRLQPAIGRRRGASAPPASEGPAGPAEIAPGPGGQPGPALRVLFSVRPYRGHLHPLVPLARAFARRGHRVAIASTEDVAAVVTGAGLPWLPAGVAPYRLIEEFSSRDPDYSVEAVQAKLEDLVEIGVGQFRPDVIVRDPTDLAPALAAELLDALSVVYGIAHFIPAESWRFLKADRTIARLRRAYGLPPDPDLRCLYRDLYLAVLPPFVEGHSPLPVPAVQHVRYVPWDGDGGGPPEGPPPARRAGERPSVLLTLGTVYNSQTELFRRLLDALAGDDIDVICTLGEDADPTIAEDAPANVRFERYAPHSSLLPGCQAIVCHGGFNTVLGALVAGVPLVCVPVGSDQDYNAAYCAARGYGISIEQREAQPEQVRRALDRVLADPSFARNVGTFQETMARRPSLGAAVRRIEAMAAARREAERSGRVSYSA